MFAVNLADKRKIATGLGAGQSDKQEFLAIS